ncbi:MAG: VWA domain-containing protein [Phycisphaeraceae bacterium]|nr:VWA domain-containing protein [Phycisphaerae bacterium]MBX3393589.1 VWA domain-containing protein [Phycisphaeraceae bacterium]
MPIHLEQPLWLISALVAAPMAIIALATFAAMSTARRAMAAAVRVMLVLLIAAMLAGLAAVRTSDRLAVIAVVDVSGSMLRQRADGVDSVASAAGLPPAAMNTIEAIRVQLARSSAGRSPDDLLGIVAFDGRPVLVAAPSADPQVTDRPLDLRIEEGTVIADALRLAATVVPSDAAARLVLITDGIETAGDARAAAREIAAAGSARAGRLVIDTVPIRYSVGPEVIVESVDAPPMAAVGAPVTIRAVIRSTDPATGTIRLFNNGSPVDIGDGQAGMGRRVNLNPGANLFVVEVEAGVSRVSRFAVVFEPDDPAAGSPPMDRIADNNTAEAFTITPSVGSVLHIDGVSEFGEAQAASPLAATLREAGISVTTITSGATPADLLSLQDYDLVILEDVPADAISGPAQQALATHVKDMGAGLVMIGGPTSFGSGGWKGSPLEPLLPVLLDLPDTLVEPEAAIVFVLDNSGSMGRSVMGSSRSQQELANESAARAVLTLGRNDLVSVIAFNNSLDVLVPLEPNTNPTRTAQIIRSISAGGGTNAGPALEEARRALFAVRAKVKHVVLLSDGKSQNSETLPAIAARLRAEGVTVSTISIGDGADRQTMKTIAELGGGEHFSPTNPNILPRVFLKAIRVVRTPLYREEPFQPVVTDPSFSILRGVQAPALLGGLNLTQPRPDPLVVNAMTTPAGEPVLAWWRTELGQAAAFTSDAGQWARSWSATPAYAQFWVQMARTLSRPTQDRLFETRLEARGDTLKVRVEAADDNGNPIESLRIPATIYAPSGEQISVVLRQTASGVYEGSARAAESGTYVAVLRPAAGERGFPPVIAGASVRAGIESLRLDPDPDLVRSIADASGGRIIELADLDRTSLFDRRGIERRRALLPLVDLLLPWTLAVLILDIAVRRIAWDRLVTVGPSVAEGSVRTLAERLAASNATPRRDADYSPAAFTQRDAEDLSRAQRDRRMAERLAGARAAPMPRPSDQADSGRDIAAPPPKDTEDREESSLAAAKRRARQRFNHDA